MTAGGGLGGGGGGGGGGAGKARKEMKSVSAGVGLASRNTARLQYPWTPVYATAAPNTVIIIIIISVSGSLAISTTDLH